MTESGEPISVDEGNLNYFADCRLLATVGERDLPESRSGVVDPKTGTFGAFDSLPGEVIDGRMTRLPKDGRITLVVRTNDNWSERVLLD